MAGILLQYTRPSGGISLGGGGGGGSIPLNQSYGPQIRMYDPFEDELKKRMELARQQGWSEDEINRSVLIERNLNKTRQRQAQAQRQTQQSQQPGSTTQRAKNVSGLKRFLVNTGALAADTAVGIGSAVFAVPTFGASVAGGVAAGAGIEALRRKALGEEASMGANLLSGGLTVIPGVGKIAKYAKGARAASNVARTADTVADATKRTAQIVPKKASQEAMQRRLVQDVIPGAGGPVNRNPVLYHGTNGAVTDGVPKLNNEQLMFLADDPEIAKLYSSKYANKPGRIMRYEAKPGKVADLDPVIDVNDKAFAAILGIREHQAGLKKALNKRGFSYGQFTHPADEDYISKDYRTIISTNPANDLLNPSTYIPVAGAKSRATKVPVRAGGDLFDTKDPYIYHLNTMAPVSRADEIAKRINDLYKETENVMRELGQLPKKRSTADIPKIYNTVVARPEYQKLNKQLQKLGASAPENLTSSANIPSFAKNGIKPSKTGYDGPGVYMANKPESTLYHVDRLEDGTLYRVNKEALAKRFGTFPQTRKGLEFDDDTGAVLLSGNRRVPNDLLEVKDASGKWKPLVDQPPTPPLKPQAPIVQPQPTPVAPVVPTSKVPDVNPNQQSIDEFKSFFKKNEQGFLNRSGTGMRGNASGIFPGAKAGPEELGFQEAFDIERAVDRALKSSGFSGKLPKSASGKLRIVEQQRNRIGSQIRTELEKTNFQVDEAFKSNVKQKAAQRVREVADFDPTNRSHMALFDNFGRQVDDATDLVNLDKGRTRIDQVAKSAFKESDATTQFKARVAAAWRDAVDEVVTDASPVSKQVKGEYSKLLKAERFLKRGATESVKPLGFSQILGTSFSARGPVGKGYQAVQDLAGRGTQGAASILSTPAMKQFAAQYGLRLIAGQPSADLFGGPTQPEAPQPQPGAQFANDGGFDPGFSTEITPESTEEDVINAMVAGGATDFETIAQGLAEFQDMKSGNFDPFGGGGLDQSDGAGQSPLGFSRDDLLRASYEILNNPNLSNKEIKDGLANIKTLNDLLDSYDKANEPTKGAKLSANQQKDITKLGQAENIIQQIEAGLSQAGLSDNLAQGTILGTYRNYIGSRISDEQAKIYKSQRDGYVANLAKALGEVGTLSDQDVKRAIALIPDLTDTNYTASEKIRRLRELLSANKQTVFSAPQTTDFSDFSSLFNESNGGF